jgi:3-oxoacyl-[acyl-carrier protein] reductase
MINVQKALVTGGVHGLGKVIADALRADGMEVFAPGSSEMDVRDAEAVKKYIGGVGDLDLLVLNAGITEDKPLARMRSEDWDRVMEVNLTGAFLGAREVARGMARRRCGHIVFISSFSALHPPVGQANYAASKAALLGLMKSMARELGPRNVRVNAILPGFLETCMTENLSDGVRESVREAHVLGHFNTPQAVADFVVFLHGRMPHTSGQEFNLDSRIVS